jgi:hypothetical protein
LDRLYQDSVFGSVSFVTLGVNQHYAGDAPPNENKIS